MDPKFFRQYTDILREFGADNGPIGSAGRLPAAPMPTGSTASAATTPATTPTATTKTATKPVRPGDASAYVGGPVDATAQGPDSGKAIGAQSKMVNNPMQDFEEDIEETEIQRLKEFLAKPY
jgi:hypothetical protein